MTLSMELGSIDISRVQVAIWRIAQLKRFQLTSQRGSTVENFQVSFAFCMFDFFILSIATKGSPGHSCKVSEGIGSRSGRDLEAFPKKTQNKSSNTRFFRKKVKKKLDKYIKILYN